MLGGKDVLKKYRKALEKMYGTSTSADSSPLAQMRKALRGLVPIKGAK